MRKKFLISAIICFVIAMIISTYFSNNASDNLFVYEDDAQQKSTVINEEITINEISSQKETEQKQDVETLSDMSASTSTAENNKVTDTVKENKSEEVVNVDVKIVETNVADLTKTDGNILSNFDINASNVFYAGKFKLTAYCPCSNCCDEYAYNRPVDNNGDTIVETASGAQAYENHTIAVDPRVIPYGTIVVIEHNGVFYEYVAEDCGGAIKNKRIDVYFDSHSTAREFGIRYDKVYLIQN